MGPLLAQARPTVWLESIEKWRPRPWTGGSASYRAQNLWQTRRARSAEQLRVCARTGAPPPLLLDWHSSGDKSRINGRMISRFCFDRRPAGWLANGAITSLWPKPAAFKWIEVRTGRRRRRATKGGERQDEINDSRWQRSNLLTAARVGWRARALGRPASGNSCPSSRAGEECALWIVRMCPHLCPPPAHHANTLNRFGFKNRRRLLDAVRRRPARFSCSKERQR